MPKQGQSVETCVILEWMKKKGDAVKIGDILFSFETDKASFDFESPASGILLDIYFNAQDDVPVLSTVAVVGDAGENTEQFKPQLSAAGGAPLQNAQALSEAKQNQMPNSLPQLKAAESPASGAASPRAKRKALERGVDLSVLAGTGPHGRIIERDVLSQPRLTKTASERFAMEGLFAPENGTGLGKRVLAKDLGANAKSQTPAVMEDTITEVKQSNMRKIIGTRMMQSLQNTAQLTMNSYADATALLAYRKQIKEKGKEFGMPDITVTDIIAFAVARTLPAFLELNGLYKDEKIFQYEHVHLAMAVDTPRGLMVPVARFADMATIAGLSANLKDLASQCKQGSINPDLLSGGTITITNLGMFGIDSFTPILNPPQVAILGVSGILPRPVALENGSYEIRPQLGFSLTIDHRAVDGAPGARFLKALCDNIANIEFMLTVWTRRK